MFEERIIFPENIFIDKFNFWNIDIDNPYRNIIQIAGIDYIISYLNDKTRKNKGGNSNIFTLHLAQEFEEKGYEDPVSVLKITKIPLGRRSKPKLIERFENEVKALYDCNNKDVENIIKIYNSGYCQVQKQIGKETLVLEFPFYTMEYSENDLKQYIESNKLDLYDSISLCIDIANGLKELKGLGYYHRDLKPDNIFMLPDGWKIGDLGLIDNQNSDFNIDNLNELIGPRGWYCPEAMNKYLTEEKGFVHKFDCKIDHQSDIFQLGEIFWYILQGNVPVGCVKPADFKIKNIKLYAIIRTMLNHSKKKRYEKIEEVIRLLNPIHLEYFKH